MTTIFVCPVCGETTTRPEAAGWLVETDRKGPAGTMVIRCPKHISDRALKRVRPDRRTRYQAKGDRTQS